MVALDRRFPHIFNSKHDLETHLGQSGEESLAELGDPEPSRPKSAENGSDASQNRSLVPESCTIATKKREKR